MGSVQTLFHNSDVGGAVKAAQMWRRLKVCNISEWWITISATNFRSEYCSECPHCTKCSWSFLWEGSFWIKFLHSKIKAMWIYTKSVGTWRFLWVDRDMIFICRTFTSKTCFLLDESVFTNFFKSSYLYLIFHVGQIPKLSGIEFMDDTIVLFYVFYKSPKCQRRVASSEIIKLDRVLTLNSSSLKQNLVISVCFNYVQVLPIFWIFR